MELGDGDFNSVLSRHGCLNPSGERSNTLDDIPAVDYTFIRYWWKEMVQCVAAAHRHDIVHSDLKPANFLCFKGGLKLIDFGIAGAIDSNETVNLYKENHVGTPNYMSPESLQDSSITNNPTIAEDQTSHQLGREMKIGTKSDVWSLGCILYQMVYGEAPFGRIQPALTKVLAIINPREAIRFPEEALDGSKVPPELRRIMRRCLDREPGKRPSCEELMAPNEPWMHPEALQDLRISQALLDQIVSRVAARFYDKNKPPPSHEEIAAYAPSFYNRIRSWAEEV